jgi:protein-disulfide isomerase
MVVLRACLLLLALGTDLWAQSPTSHDVFRYILRNRPATGSERAPITLIEFSDFQCSFCWRFWKDTLPLLKDKYIQTGKVRFFYHHFAIFGKPSTLAAQASECAHEQGKFWAYHDKLFSQTRVPLAFTDAMVKIYARELTLESKTFNQCVNAQKYAARVEAESAMSALLGIRGTPAFFLNQQFLAGAQPFEVFEAAIESELGKAGKQGGQKSSGVMPQPPGAVRGFLTLGSISSYR